MAELHSSVSSMLHYDHDDRQLKVSVPGTELTGSLFACFISIVQDEARFVECFVVVLFYL